MEKDKLRMRVREKNKVGWPAFCEERGEKDPWEIVKWAKDPWHLKAIMGDLTDTAVVPLKTGNEKKNGLKETTWGGEMKARRLIR